MNKSKVFVIMPFADEFFEAYEMIKEHFQDRFEFSHAGDEDNQQNILADIIPPIYNADIVLADLTGLNANVMYELGIAHSFNKKTIIITKDDISNLPFDLKQYRTKQYSTHFKRFFELLSYLEKHLCGATDGTVVFNNPVNDFLNKNGLDPQCLFAQNKINVEISDDENGFIDFLANIEDDTTEMTSHIVAMNSEMQAMNVGINNCVSEINRVNSNGGNGSASFVKKQAKRIASHIESFSKQLKCHNTSLSSLWTGIEKNTLGLIENSFSSSEQNIDALVRYLSSLTNMKDAIIKSNQAVKSMKETSLKNIGLQRSLNQSIRFLDEDLDTYLTITDQMVSSIDRIISKSKFVVGDFTSLM